MWNGHPVTKASRPQPLTSEQAVGDQRSAEAMEILEQQTRFFESALFAVASTLTST